jgi:hypothetical protein
MTTNLASAIFQAEEKARLAKLEVIKLVAEARAQGMSWQDIANILGCSRQNARMRFSKYLEETITVTVKLPD